MISPRSENPANTRKGKKEEKHIRERKRNIMKKLISLALALVMILSLSVNVFADDTTTYTLTLNGAQPGHTYTAYQIFAGDLSGDTLSNIVWGSGVTADGQTALGNAATKAETLKVQADAEAFAAAVAPYLGTAAGSVKIADA